MHNGEYPGVGEKNIPGQSARAEQVDIEIIDSEEIEE